MLLRASSDFQGQNLNLNAVTDPSIQLGLAQEDLIAQLVAALLEDPGGRLTAAVAAADESMGRQESTDVLTVACGFNGITRVADATGIPLDTTTEATTSAMRATTGIDDYAYARKSTRFAH
jgi:hypothetical protein